MKIWNHPYESWNSQLSNKFFFLYLFILFFYYTVHKFDFNALTITLYEFKLIRFPVKSYKCVKKWNFFNLSRHLQLHKWKTFKMAYSVFACAISKTRTFIIIWLPIVGGGGAYLPPPPLVNTSSGALKRSSVVQGGSPFLKHLNGCLQMV